jgi:uncharacterized membrane protein YjjB (DUF3815 family)
MFTVVVCLLLILGVAALIARYGKEGWRTRIFMWGITAVNAFAAVASSLLDSLVGVDWSRLIDKPALAYATAIAVPIVGGWFRELTHKAGALVEQRTALSGATIYWSSTSLPAGALGEGRGDGGGGYGGTVDRGAGGGGTGPGA